MLIPYLYYASYCYSYVIFVLLFISFIIFISEYVSAIICTLQFSNFRIFQYLHYIYIYFVSLMTFHITFEITYTPGCKFRSINSLLSLCRSEHRSSKCRFMPLMTIMPACVTVRRRRCRTENKRDLTTDGVDDAHRAGERNKKASRRQGLRVETARTRRERSHAR